MYKDCVNSKIKQKQTLLTRFPFGGTTTFMPLETANRQTNKITKRLFMIKYRYK
jgi:hypothetical protein